MDCCHLKTGSNAVSLRTFETAPRLFLSLFIAAMFMFASFAVAADGVFRGRVVDPPVAESEHRGWIFVQGRNKLVRRVEVEHAIVLLPSSARPRRSCNSECIMPGQEVRIPASQDSAGEWRAKKVEILKLAPSTRLFASNHGISLGPKHPIA
jgi:hypothetical protein